MRSADQAADAGQLSRSMKHQDTIALPELLERLSRDTASRPSWLTIFDGNAADREGGMGLAASTHPGQDGSIEVRTAEGQLAELRPSLLGGQDVFVDGHLEAHMSPNVLGGVDVRGVDGQHLLRIDDNLFGGVDFRDAMGQYDGSMNPNELDGFNILDQEGSVEAWTHPNIDGGQDIELLEP